MLTFAEVCWRMLTYAVAVAVFARIPLSACAGRLKHNLAPYVEPLTHATTICVYAASLSALMRTSIYVSSERYVSSADTYCYICVLIALQTTMCPQRTDTYCYICVPRALKHASMYVSSGHTYVYMRAQGMA